MNLVAFTLYLPKHAGFVFEFGPLFELGAFHGLGAGHLGRKYRTSSERGQNNRHRCGPLGSCRGTLVNFETNQCVFRDWNENSSMLV